MKKLILLATVFASLVNAQITIPRLTRKVETSAPQSIELQLRRGETVDFGIQFTSYAAVMDLTGATVTLHAITNGMTSGTSFQVSGTASSNGTASVRIVTDEWVPTTLSTGTWTMEVAQPSLSRIMRASGDLRVTGLVYPSAASPLPVSWATNIWTAIGAIQSRTNDWDAAISTNNATFLDTVSKASSAFSWGDHSLAGYLSSSTWVLWLSTNTYLKVEADPYLSAQNAATKELTGFADPSSITVSYSSSARTITLTQMGGLTIWWRGTLLTLTSPWTSIAHTNAAGKYYLAMRDSTNAVWSTDPWTFDMAQIAFVNYTSASEAIGFRECHGLMPWQCHEADHRTIGTYRTSGGEPVAGTYVLQSDINSNNTPSFAAAVIKDEDNKTTIPLWLQDAYTLLSFTNATKTAVFTTNRALPFFVGSNYPLINTSASNFTETVSGRFFNVYQQLIPSTADSLSQLYRTVLVQPQFVYTTVEAALAEDFRSLSLGTFTAFGPEFVGFTKLTYRTFASYSSTGKTRLEAISYLSGSQASQTLITQLTAIDHVSTLNRDAPDSHPTSAITGLESALAAIPPSVLTNQTWGASGTNLQIRVFWDITNGTFAVEETTP